MNQENGLIAQDLRSGRNRQKQVIDSLRSGASVSDVARHFLMSEEAVRLIDCVFVHKTQKEGSTMSNKDTILKLLNVSYHLEGEVADYIVTTDGVKVLNIDPETEFDPECLIQELQEAKGYMKLVQK